MTPSERAKFIIELCDRSRDAILKCVGAMPDNWDGHELRRYIADHFEDQVFDMNRTRLLEYRNDVITRQGL